MVENKEKLEEFINRLKEIFIEFEIAGSASINEDGKFEFDLYDKHGNFMVGLEKLEK